MELYPASERCTFAPDYQIGLELGFGGLLEKVRYYAKLYPQQAEFYQAEEDVLFGIRTWIARTVDEIHRMAQVEQDLERKNNLQEMERSMNGMIDHPPRTFSGSMSIYCMDQYGQSYLLPGRGWYTAG